MTEQQIKDIVIENILLTMENQSLKAEIEIYKKALEKKERYEK